LKNYCGRTVLPITLIKYAQQDAELQNKNHWRHLPRQRQTGNDASSANIAKTNDNDM
jgi:hypothetical protein